MTETSTRWPSPPRRRTVNISPMRYRGVCGEPKGKAGEGCTRRRRIRERLTQPLILRDQAYIAKGLSRILGVEQETIWKTG